LLLLSLTKVKEKRKACKKSEHHKNVIYFNLAKVILFLENEIKKLFFPKITTSNNLGESHSNLSVRMALTFALVRIYISI